MDRGVYTIGTGMMAAQRAQEVIANNLANANTTGFKQDGLMFADALVRQMSANGGTGTDLGSLGSGAEIKDGFTNFSQGPINTTGSPLDIAIEGNGMFAVQGANGQINYTRDGSFAMSVDGTLVTKTGLPVLDPSLNPIKLDKGSIAIAANGSITVGQSAKAVAQIGLFDGTFVKQGGNLYVAQGEAQAIDTKVAGTSQFHQGAVEGSNVSPVQAMTEMIRMSRMFDLAEKSAQSQDELTQKLISSMNS